MKLSHSFFYTMRENAKDEDSTSGNLLVRSGMIKKSSSGIYMTMPLGKKVLHKIENIVREEMDAIGAQELSMPSLILEEVYEASGRRDVFGSNMFALKDRYEKNYVLGPTHEELFAMAACMKGKSYKDFPYNLYQIQTKYRDETRPRYGLIRVREFLMKDAYSFDIDEQGLDVSYTQVFEAYKRIFNRLGLQYKIVKADTGAMGGLLSEEFQAICEIGEDVVVSCEHCDFSSNLEISEVISTYQEESEELLAYEKVHTPGVKTIEEVASFLQLPVHKIVKTLLYMVDDQLYAFLVKGDREINETKVRKLLEAKEVRLATYDEIETKVKTSTGYVGPVGLDCAIIMDLEVAHMHNFITGANEKDYHYKNVNVRDFNVLKTADIVCVKEGDLCPKCKQPLVFHKGIEIGNTFKLGTKYAQSLGLNYLDANNQLCPVVMGSYGIGIGRCMAAVVEQNHDENGMIWPKEIAPYEVAIVVVSMKDEEQVKIANTLYEELRSLGVDVLLDDRQERPGVKFKDMELIGIPVRITVGRGIQEGKVEIRKRTETESFEVSLEEVMHVITSM
ncbi:MAG: proline--tRNA ligase [Erysipelotrichaceae bacterium]|nr:proline--tRNA ligase [Erysipelotrichaceae bacterium]